MPPKSVSRGYYNNNKVNRGLRQAGERLLITWESPDKASSVSGAWNSAAQEKGRILAKHHWDVLVLMALCCFSIASHHILTGISPQDSHIATNQVLSTELPFHLTWRLPFFLSHKNKDENVHFYLCPRLLWCYLARNRIWCYKYITALILYHSEWMPLIVKRHGMHMPVRIGAQQLRSCWGQGAEIQTNTDLENLQYRGCCRKRKRTDHSKATNTFLKSLNLLFIISVGRPLEKSSSLTWIKEGLWACMLEWGGHCTAARKIGVSVRSRRTGWKSVRSVLQAWSGLWEVEGLKLKGK